MTRTFLTLALAGVLAGCGHKVKDGEDCTTNADCGSGSTCMQVYNAQPTCGPGPSTCQHVCATAADCANTSGVFGSTPACGSDCHGNRFCTPAL